MLSLGSVCKLTATNLERPMTAILMRSLVQWQTYDHLLRWVIHKDYQKSTCEIHTWCWKTRFQVIQLFPLKLHTMLNIFSLLYHCSLKDRDIHWNSPCSIWVLKSLGGNEQPQDWQLFVSICVSLEAWRLLQACQKRLYGGIDTKSKVSKSYIDLKRFSLRYQTLNTSILPKIEPFPNRGL